MRVLVRVVLILALVALGVWGFAYFTWIRHTEQVTSLPRYESVIRELKQAHPETTHFPDRIPPSARDPKFFYVPGFLQGSTMLRLRLTLPPAEIIAIEQRLRATQHPLIANEIRDIGAADFSRGWLAPDEKPGSLAIGEDFVSFLLSPDLETAKRNWNHPANGGISLSVSLNQVLYWFN